MTYLYYCPHCKIEFEVKKSMYESSRREECPKCGLNASRRYTATPALFGWRLTDKSHERGQKDELERNI